MNTLPDAVRLADWVDSYRTRKATVLEDVAAELRRLHEVNQMLVGAVEMALYVVNEHANSHSYYDESDEVGVRSCCGVVSYKPHLKDCETTKALEALRQALSKAKEQA